MDKFNVDFQALILAVVQLGAGLALLFTGKSPELGTALVGSAVGQNLKTPVTKK